MGVTTIAKTRFLVTAALMTALTAACAFFPITVPLSPVPLTLQTLFVLLSGLLLGPWGGAASQAAFVALGLMGIPIFASGTCGPAAVMTPSFGYLLSFPAAAFAAGKLTQRKQSVSRTALAVAAASLIIHLIGIPYLIFIVKHVMGSDKGVWTLVFTYFVLYLPGDALKAAAAAGVFKAVRHALGKQMLP